jgi:hypothetical protein
LTLGVRVPDYEVDKRFWPNRHYEGGYLFRDSLALELTPPKPPSTDWAVLWDWQSDNVGQASTPVPVTVLDKSKVEVRIPFFTSDRTPPRSPGIEGILRFVISKWNSW